MNKKGKHHLVAMSAIVAVVAVVAVAGLLMNAGSSEETSITGQVAAGKGACVIIPNINAPVESLGEGLIKHENSVCDAAYNGYDYCLGYCANFNKIVDKYGFGGGAGRTCDGMVEIMEMDRLDISLYGDCGLLVGQTVTIKGPDYTCLGNIERIEGLRMTIQTEGKCGLKAGQDVTIKLK